MTQKTPITKPKKIYMIGIKGVGMSALALLYKSQGYDVSGSDTREHFFTDDILRRNNIPFFDGFDAAHVPSDAELIIASTAYLLYQGSSHKKITTPNPEIQAALANDLPLLTYPEAVASVFNAHKQGIAVTGSHGKSTTSAMIAWIFEQAGLDPSALIGSSLISWQSNARAGQSDYIVIEADDYEEKFLLYKPHILVITNTDWDHPDYFPTAQSYLGAYKKLITTLPPTAHLVINAQDKDLVDLVRAPHATKAAVHEFRGSDGQGLHLQPNLAGTHNLQNAAAATQVARLCGIDDNTITAALRSFAGIKRRMEPMGSYRGAILIDDYAHHPTEVQATLQAIRDMYPEKPLYVVFHPHTYTRTETFFADFAHSFTNADFVIILDVYGSAREAQGKIGSAQLARAIKKSWRTLLASKPSAHVKHIPTIERATFFLMEHLRGDEVVVSMGAGDVWRVTKALADYKNGIGDTTARSSTK